MTDREAFDAWFQARWPEFAHPTTSAFEIWQAATAAERERCAKVCDALCVDYGSRYNNTPQNERRPARVSTYTKGVSVGAGLCAEAIRRGE